MGVYLLGRFLVVCILMSHSQHLNREHEGIMATSPSDVIVTVTKENGQTKVSVGVTEQLLTYMEKNSLLHFSFCCLHILNELTETLIHWV